MPTIRTVVSSVSCLIAVDASRSGNRPIGCCLRVSKHREYVPAFVDDDKDKNNYMRVLHTDAEDTLL